MTTTPLKLGDRAVDRVTGLSGTVTGIAHYLDETDRIELTPTLIAGKVESFWFAAGRIEKAGEIPPALYDPI